MTLRGHNLLHFGEGQPLFNVGIPEISIVTAPDYLCVESETDEMEKFNIDLMYEQTKTFEKVIKKIDSFSAKDIGNCDDYSIVKANSVSGRDDMNMNTFRRKVMSVIKKQ